MGRTAGMRAFLPRLLLLGGAACALDGPAPVIEQVTPPVQCVGAPAVTHVLSGEGFTPLARDALDGEPALELPGIGVLHREATDGFALAGPELATIAEWVSAREMRFTLPQLTPGVWDVEVVNPDGDRGLLEAGLRAVLPPTITLVLPEDICDGGGSFAVQGTRFQVGATVTVGGAPAQVTGGDATNLQVTLPVGSVSGVGRFDLVISNPDGCQVTLVGGLRNRVGGC